MNNLSITSGLAVSYLTTGLRNIFRRKLYSLILLTGMAIGLACLGLIIKFILFETSYDSFHKNAADIYRVTGQEWAPSAAALGPAMKQYFPVIKDYTRLAKAEKINMKADESVFYQDGILFVESSFFSLFSFKILNGQPPEALNEPGAVYLTEVTAKKYFGNSSPLGRKLIYDGKYALIVKGIVDEPPVNSQITYNMIISLCTMKQIAGTDFLDNKMNTSVYTYLLLHRVASPDVLSQKMEAFYRNYFDSGYYDFISKSFKDMVTYKVQPLLFVHLHSGLNAELGNVGSINAVIVFSALAALILIIACINYINLSTARAFARMKETGVRKVLGSGRLPVLLQFTGESVMLALMAWPVSLLLIEAVEPGLKNILNNRGFLDYGIFSYHLLLFLLALVTGTISGIGPAMLLAGANPSNVLSGLRKKAGRFRLGNILMTFQFAVSVILMACAIVIFMQTDYMKNRHLNFIGEQMLIVPLRDSLVRSNLPIFKEELKKINGALSAAGSSVIPGEVEYVTSFQWDGMKDINDNTISFMAVDKDFIETYKIKLTGGRAFSFDYTSDNEQAYMINKAAALRLGYPDPLNKNLRVMSRNKQGTIVGITEDFCFQPSRKKTDPLVLFLDESQPAYLSVRIDGSDAANTTAAIKAKWKELFPDRPFDYDFLDGRYDRIFKSETETGSLVFFFSIMAVFISSLGMIGLVSLSLERRTKEIGIRLALGASLNEILKLVGGEYIGWMLAANIAAWPVVWQLMTVWLQQFSNRISLNIWILIVPSLIIFVISAIVLGLHAFKAASENPVNNLRYE